jgi:hypothetical protein
MSTSRTVYVRRKKLLTPKAWASAIRAAGFPMDLDVDFDLEGHSGFLECVHDGESSGFEYAFATVEEIEEENDDDEEFEMPEIGNRDIGISFVTHASSRGLVTAVIAAAVLCEKADGLMYDDEAGELIPGDEALEYAREIIASVGNDLD